MVMCDNEFETKENKISTKDKIEPQHICRTWCIDEQEKLDFINRFRTFFRYHECVQERRNKRKIERKYSSERPFAYFFSDYKQIL